jgi:hypothetical protein
MAEVRTTTAGWVWDDDSGYVDDYLDVVLVARNVRICGVEFVVFVGMRDNGRYYWWATATTTTARVMYTGEARFDRWSMTAQGSDDWERAADDAELSLRALGFRQETK